MNYILEKIENSISDLLKETPPLISPPSHIDADLALPFSGEEEARNSLEKIEGSNLDHIEKAEVKNNFLNFTLDRSSVYGSVLQNVINLDGKYGENDINEDKKAFIEYSSPNVAKPIGIGHLRSTIIGESLSRIYEATGFEVLRANYLGDWGTQFGQLIVAFRKWGDEEDLKNHPLDNLKDLYVKFQEEAKEDESLQQEAREIFHKLENGDKEIRELWEKFRSISIEEFKGVYDRLGVEFDKYSGESFFAESAIKEVESCLEKEVCEKGERGSVVVKDLEGLPTFLLQKEDGSTLYMTRDLAAIKKRIKKYKPDTVLYVVGNEQELHFRQLFSLANSMGYLNDVKPKHISFGLIMIDGSPMSTRKGTLIKLEDLLDEAVSRADSIIEKKNPDLREEERREVANQVGIGSIIYNDLSHQRNKNISFDWDKMLDLSAGSGPYLQYTHARIKSILRKSEEFNEGEVDSLDDYSFENEIEFQIVQRLMFFPRVIEKAWRNDAPHTLCGYLEDLASDFNTFYGEVSVLGTEDREMKISRLTLIYAVAVVLRRGLALLNIEAPEKM